MDSSKSNSIRRCDFFMITFEFATKQVFGSREEMMDWVQNLAYSLGVVVVTKRLNKRPCGFVYKVVLRCDRGGEYKVKDSFRVSSTKKTNCPFELEGQYYDEYDSWTLRVICDEHNHQRVQYMESHPFAKRLSDDEFSLVSDLTRMNVAPHNILSMLKERNLSNVSTPRTIYNTRNKIRMVEQVGKSPMQVLMEMAPMFWKDPNEFQYHKALAIALVNDENHYVMMELQGEYPMPVITPYWNFRNISSFAVG
ncbi:hypothetical protein E3N88_18796 [Mikania micrantha]|uniref:Protein FAR1-RELATED SEQUENCE n=1 Tax=Mikania micrantha TaxID=192012 RepID=A0A5N6NN33_9ASTR|nr:hypothetical protein E3N88_18796 [Mikania micrantha]